MPTLTLIDPALYDLFVIIPSEPAPEDNLIIMKE